MHNVLAWYTTSEASTIVKSVAEQDAVEAWATFHASYHRRTLGRMFTVKSEWNVSACTPSQRNAWAKVRLAFIRSEDKWRAIMSEHRFDVKISDLWRMSALVETCTTDAKEHMPMRQEEPQGEGGVVHDKQTKTDTKSTESDGGAAAG